MMMISRSRWFLFGPLEKTAARFGSQPALLDHFNEYCWRREPRAMRRLEGSRDVEANIEPDDVAQPQGTNGMSIGQHRRAIDVFGARYAALEHPHRLEAGDQIETAGGKAGNIADSQ